PHHHFAAFTDSSPAPDATLHSFPTRRSSDLAMEAMYVDDLTNTTEILLERRRRVRPAEAARAPRRRGAGGSATRAAAGALRLGRSEEHTSELQSLAYLVCRLLLEKKKCTSPS